MKKIIAIFILLASIQTAFSQHEYDNEAPDTEEEFVGFDKKNKEKKDWVERLRIGGNFGFGFGNGNIALNLSPLVGYQVVEDRLEIGTGIIYEYYKYNSRAKENIVGTNNYARLYIWDGLFAQFRGIYVRSKINYSGGGSDVARAGNAFAGGGYGFPIGDRGSFNLGVEVNLIEYDLDPKRRFYPFFNIQMGF